MKRLLPTVLILLLAPAAAEAAPTCSFDPPTAHVEISDDDGSAITLERAGAGPGVPINWSHGAAPLAPCGAATVSNTDSIRVTSNAPNQATLVVDLGGGQLAPGVTSEAPAPSEIEITSANFKVQVRGGAGGDSVRAGAGGIDLNRDAETALNADTDLFFDGTDPVNVQFYGQDGNDVFSGQGVGLVATPIDIPLFLLGGGGGDALTGGGGGDSLNGYIGIGPGDPDGADTLSGGAGDDILDGGLGDEAMSGGPGIDTGNYSNTPPGATVDLRLTGPQPTGQGNDTLSGIENLNGSLFLLADSLTGDAGPNRIDGQNGDDLIDGQSGPDLLIGGSGANRLLARDGGPDTVQCGGGADAVTADQQGVDSLTPDCESIDFFVPAAPDPGGGQGGLPAPPADTAVRLDLSAARTQRVLKQKALKAAATCVGEPCAATVDATIQLPGGRTAAKRRALALGTVKASLPSGRRTALSLKLSPKQLRAVGKALPRKRSRLTAVIRVSVKDAGGNGAARSTTVKIVR